MRSDKTAMMIELITSWILTTFSAFAPKWELAELGTAFRGSKIELLQGFPLQNFSPTSENFFSFLPCLPRWKAGLSTAYCVLAKRPSQCNRNALHTATETPFTVQPKRPSYCNRTALSFFAKMHHEPNAVHFSEDQKGKNLTPSRKARKANEFGTLGALV
jgi:hypothetical protein